MCLWKLMKDYCLQWVDDWLLLLLIWSGFITVSRVISCIILVNDSHKRQRITMLFRWYTTVCTKWKYTLGTGLSYRLRYRGNYTLTKRFDSPTLSVVWQGVAMLNTWSLPFLTFIWPLGMFLTVFFYTLQKCSAQNRERSIHTLRI